MKRLTVVLLVLLLLDVLTTFYLLEYIPNTMEINPLLNRFGNVILAVILTHIFAALIVVALDVHHSRLSGAEKRRLDFLMLLVIVFYTGVVTFNIINIVMGHMFLL